MGLICVLSLSLVAFARALSGGVGGLAVELFLEGDVPQLSMRAGGGCSGVLVALGFSSCCRSLRCPTSSFARRHGDVLLVKLRVHAECLF